MTLLSRSVRRASHRSGLMAVLLVGCRTDCFTNPCAEFEAVAITVSGAGSSGVPTGLAIGINGIPPQTGLCDTAGVCHVPGSSGAYHLTITANGFSPRVIDVTVTGEPAGCNTCGHVDRQQLSVVLQPGP